jgi:cyclase
VSAPSLRTAAHTSTALVEIADGVHAYVQPDGGWCVNNAGVLVDDDGVVVIDTVATQARAHRMREAINGLHAGPVRTIVNTHSHGDHTFGNSVFGPGATVIAHELARTEMAEVGLALTGLWPQVEWGEVHLRLPSVTFHDQLRVHLGKRRVELIHIGPAHTTNDVVAWLPDERVLFAGDVVMSGCTPFHLMGSVLGTLRALARLRTMEPDVVVCGHGPVAGPAVFDTAEEYLRWIVRLAERGIAAGLPPLDLARETELGKFGELLDPERIVGNLHRAYAELRGEVLSAPLDVVGIFGEMVEFNGGKLPDCLA